MLLAIITRFFVSFIKEPVLISMFGFFMIKLDRWITSKNKTAFARINIINIWVNINPIQDEYLKTVWKRLYLSEAEISR